MEEFGCHVSEQTYEGNVYIHMRFFNTNPRRSHTRQKRYSINIRKMEKKISEDCIGDINTALDDIKKEDASVSYKGHLGHNVHVTVKQGYNFVDIRK